MAQKRGFEEKTELTPIERLKVAYFHEARGVAQQVLADLYDVNVGRVNEAIQAIRVAVGLKHAGP